jgi:hypothetical protein
VSSLAAAIDHWDGARWRRVDVELPPGTTTSHFDGISAALADDVWEVGGGDMMNGYLLEHWDRKTWTLMPSPNSANPK